MKTYDQLTEEQKEKAIEKAVTDILTDIIEHGICFNDELNGDDLQQRIDAAAAKADEMQTPWFVHEYIMDTCEDDIMSLATARAEDAFYPEPGEIVLYL